MNLAGEESSDSNDGKSANIILSKPTNLESIQAFAADCILLGARYKVLIIIGVDLIILM